MKFQLKVLFQISIIVCIISSCTPPVTIHGKKENFEGIEKIALIQTIIAPHTKKTFPLIDAAIYNSKLDEIAPEIIKVNETKIDTFDLYIGEKIKNYTKLDVLYGDSLRRIIQNKKLKKKVKVYSLAYNDKDFPKVIIPNAGLNFFDFSSTHPFQYFSNNENFDTLNIQNICNLLDVDAVAVAIIGIVPEATPGLFYSNWHRNNYSQIYFFDYYGDRILDMSIIYKEKNSDANSLPDYVYALNKTFFNFDFMFKVLYGEVPNRLPKSEKRR